jgi:polysaccharide biosynthesis PFTS motif protein
LVWDEYQADFIKRAIGSSYNIYIVGPIYFSDSSKQFILPDSIEVISVFDVQPVRDSIYQFLGLPVEYYIPETSKQFLSDIHGVLKGKGVKMILKRKRNIGKLVHSGYSNFLSKLAKSEYLLEADPDLSARRIIEKSTLVISMPFTSTAIIAKELGKPSIYYDPHGMIQKDDRAAHGIQVVSGYKELENWISQVLRNT